MEKTNALSIFKKAIDDLDPNKHYYHCEFFSDFYSSGIKYELNKRSALFLRPTYTLILGGKDYFSQCHIQITGREFKELQHYLEQKIVSLRAENIKD